MMLYDPKWEVKAEPSLADFVDWLRTQDPKHDYSQEWVDPHLCPCGRYSEARLGYSRLMWGAYSKLAGVISQTAHPHRRGLFRGVYPQTYGQLLKEVEKLLP